MTTREYNTPEYARADFLALQSFDRMHVTVLLQDRDGHWRRGAVEGDRLICPVAYQMSACHAMETAFGVNVEGPLRALRRLLYCGEWIESHALHMFLLHLPDFLGYESAISLAADHRDTVAKALQLKKAGNSLVSALGGREVHPINARVGGFHRVPTKAELLPVAKQLQANRDFAIEAVRFVAKLEYPDLERDYDCVALRHSDEVPLNEGHIATSRGLDVPVTQFRDHYEEIHDCTLKCAARPA